ncbi:uncharacterized protein LOC127093731 [Lathyrus oleraceus]|uniref:uncharacterized protein LOC127093731 n=1 Tax=Pisum sativum TaxID=3888 RepID=UPI0021CF853E|nr:uncharacterized protein LOC127093731 [Pisum sativum]
MTRLVAKSFKQKKCVNYFDPYAPLARMTEIRVLFVLTSSHDLIVHQMDIKTTFLNGYLDKEIYMEQPKAYMLPGNEQKMFIHKVKRNNGGYEFSQIHYVEKMLDKFKHLRFKEVNTPFDPNLKLKKNNGRALDQWEYASTIGWLMNLMQCTRPDIAFVVSKMSKFTSNLNGEH